MKFSAGLVMVVVLATLTVASGQIKCPQGPHNCACTLQYDPVCSKIGCTYANACVMKCAGQKLLYRGECRKRPIYG